MELVVEAAVLQSADDPAPPDPRGLVLGERQQPLDHALALVQDLQADGGRLAEIGQKRAQIMQFCALFVVLLLAKDGHDLVQPDVGVSEGVDHEGAALSVDREVREHHGHGVSHRELGVLDAVPEPANKRY